MPRKILIVDDLSVNRRILGGMLRKDYDIMEAGSGEEALKLLALHYANISAVLLDISMPGIDGYEVLRRIRDNAMFAQLPVIMITGSEDEASRVRSLALGANDFVMKPYSSEVIKHCLKNNIAFKEAAATVNALQRDRLTGLYNREAFFEKARELIREKPAGYYILGCADVDNFKVINDQYGNEMGDKVLKSLANALQTACDTQGGICGRVYADCFVSLYHSTLMESGKIGPQPLETRIYEDTGLRPTLSIGRYLITDGSLSVSAMYDRAAIAKNAVKGRYDTHVAMYDESMRNHIVYEQSIVNGMNAALAEKQFEVWFQPQYNHATDALIGAEALVRWRHPEKGLIPPNDFIPVFEQNGFIYSLDKFVWEEVCRYLRRWTDEGRAPLPVSVNISRYDILRSDIVETVTGLVEKYALPKDMLRLEITETAFAEASQHIVNVVKEFIACGFTVEIDDFGSGYSSLNTLKDVPAQILKLDMKFLENSDDSERGGNIVESIVRMAKWLNMSVIAEGVETLAQANYLRSIGCNYMQGYLYARPMPAKEYEVHCKGSGKEERLLALETVENLNNNAFWDPASMDTLIFNSYVGAACIFEYHNRNIELLRVNAKFAAILGDGALSVEDTLRLDWIASLAPDSLALVRDVLRRSAETGDEYTEEYVFRHISDGAPETYLRATMRVIATAGARMLVYCTSENITAQRKAEREVREAIEQIQTLMTDTPGGFARMRMRPDGTGRTEYANDGFCEMLGMTREEVLYTYRNDLMAGVHPDDVAKVSEEVAHAAATDGLLNTKYRLRKKDGDYVWTQIFARFVKAEHGDTIVNCYYANMSELEKREQDLRETMPFILSAIMESSQNLDFAKDKDFNYICCSPAFAKFTRQKTAADVIGKNDYDFWTKEEADRFRDDDMRLFAGGESLINFTEPIPSDDGVQHYSVTSKHIIRDSAGEIIGLYGSGRDITDTRAALDRLQLLTDSVPGGIATYAVSPESMKIIYFNDGFVKLFGCTREEYNAYSAKKGVVSLVFPEDLPGIMEQLNALMARGTPIDCTYRSRKLDGSGYVWLNLRGVLAERHDDTVFINAVLYDVTASHEAEQKERQSAQRLQAIMDNAGTGIRAMTLSGDNPEYLFTNEKFFKLQGYTRAQYEAEVTDAYNVIHPDDRPLARETIQNAVHVGDFKRIQFRIVTRDGDTKWLRAIITVTRFDDVASPVQLCVYTDVTEIKQNELRIRALNENMQALLDDMPGGFIRMRIEADGTQTPVYINKGLEKLLGLTHAEAMAAVADGTRPSVHPDDAETARAANEAVAGMLKTGETRRTRYRLMRGDGSYIWLSVLGRVTKDAAGNAFLNVYYTDASEQVNEEVTQRSLLDNLPGGAGVYAYHDKQLSVVYLNKSYWELVGRKPGNYADTSGTAAVHPDDLNIVIQELAAAIEQKRDLACDIRLRHEKDGYFPVHLAGHVTKTDDGQYLIYTVFVPILKDNVTYQRMLPLLLSTIMEASNDYAFAKDKDFRYICCSPAFLRLAGLKEERSVVGKTDYDIFPVGMAEQFRLNDVALLDSGKPMIDFEETVHSQDGTLHYCLASKHILRDATGTGIGIYGVSRDITKERGMLEQLQLINDSIPGGLATYAYKDGALRIVYCNDGFVQLFGGSREGFALRGDFDPIEWVSEQDRQELLTQIAAIVEHNAPMDCVFRIHVLGGGYKWINEKAVAAEHRGDTVLFNAILLDITERQNALERLRISEEENSLAVRLGGNVVCRYIIAERTLVLSPETAASYALPEKLEDVPYGPVRSGMISPESADAYIGFFEAILHGSKAGTATFQQRYFGGWRWLEAKSSTVFSDDGEPAKAVISFYDVTERLESETIYKKWQQSLLDRPPESYTLFRCNLNRNASYDTREGTLLAFDFDDAGITFNERAKAYAERCVLEDDRAGYLAFTNSDAMLAGYYRGKRSETLEYRELLPEGDARWLRLTIDLVESPNSTDVEAYLMYEDIDEAKKAELVTKALSETDPLTGLLNRTTFAARAERIIRASKPESRHALLLMDVDGFKQVNDVFGHGAGDQALIDIAGALSAMLRRDDLVARLGGDEFLVFLSDIFDDASAATKAKQICAATRKSFSLEARISASVGIALVPNDGLGFETLYKKADAALYYVKGAGKDGYAFYREDIAAASREREEPIAPTAGKGKKGKKEKKEKKRRMLIVEDNRIDYAMLQNIFQDTYIIEKAQDGPSALSRLRHYGNAISVVLLDLMMPGMGGFAVLDKMRGSVALSDIPVVIVSGDESREACLEAIRKGATDFINKPVDPELLRIRVRSAVSKAENERLRAQNSLLEVQNEERVRYEAALESTGITLITCNWLTGEFDYPPSISDSLRGAYDNRPLWQILLADKVADVKTVQNMQQLVRQVAEDVARTSGNGVVELKTSQNETHRFRMYVRKQANEFPFTHRLSITLDDLDYDGH